MSAAVPNNPNIHPVRLTNNANKQYTALVHMGAGPVIQELNFTLSSTVGYTLVAGTSCTNCGSNVPTYNSSESTTFHSYNQNVVMNTGSGTATGVRTSDSCGLAQQNGTIFVYGNQTLVIANSTDDSADLFGPQTSGVLGLGYSTVAKPTDSWMGMWLEMHPNVSTIYIGVALNHFQDFGDDGGTMHIPLADTSAYIGNIATMPVQSFGGSANSTNSTATGAGVVPQTGSNDWAIQLDSITFQNNGFRVQSGAGDLAIIEPSFPDIIIPNNQSQPIYASITGAVQTSASTTDGITWDVPCNSQFNLTIQIGGIPILVTEKDLVLNATVASSTTCPSALRAWNTTDVNVILLGTAFMRNAYVVYSMAQSSDPSSSSQTNNIGVAQRSAPDNAATPPPSINKSQSNVDNNAIIAGSVIGGVAVFAIAASLLIFFRLRRQSRSRYSGNGKKAEYLDGKEIEPWTVVPGSPPAHIAQHQPLISSGNGGLSGQNSPLVPLDSWVERPGQTPRRV